MPGLSSLVVGSSSFFFYVLLANAGESLTGKKKAARILSFICLVVFSANPFIPRVQCLQELIFE